MAQNYHFCIIAIIISLSIVHSQAETFSGQNPCISKTTCHDCIQTPSCAWCSQPADIFGEHPRCFQPAGQQQLHKRCPDDFIYFPSNNYIVKTARELHKGHGSAFGASGGASGGQSGSASGFGGAAGGGGGGGAASGQGSGFAAGGGGAASDIVQITPQRIQMKLRAQESQSIHVYFAQAEDYPVDLYYLMDLSKSMEDDKEKLSILGELLSSTMRKMTSNFQLGFGSFVDKVVMPYVNTVEAKLKMPCTNCTAPYGYLNHLTLSNDTTLFSDMVKAARVSGNLDAPEGGFDAIMQAVVCKDTIGWRDKARRLLVFSTDAGFHYAGDGKLGGIIKPNDGACHLSYDSYLGGQTYSFSKKQDYPSISQLNLIVKQNAINVIFAVTEEQKSIYEKLQSHIEGSSSGTLSADSSNVVDLVKKQYEAITSRVELKHNATDGVEIRFYTRGTSSNMSMAEVNTNIVEKFKVGQIIDFRVDIFLKECPKDPKKWKQLIEIYPVAISEKLFIELEMLCSCPCENPGNMGYKPFAPECSTFGTYKCGICECDGLHFGRKCECAPGEYHGKNTTQGCKPPDKPDAIECSGKGTCICNRCECDLRDNINETISGTWCECNNFSCYRHGGEICGGHGACDCGECRCFPPWTGKACECYNATNICFPPFKDNPKLCDGHGDCVCGSCQCHTTAEGKYTGRYCERCPNCTEICDELKPCVLCQMYHVGPYNDDECVERCKNFTPIEVEVVQADEQNDEFPCVGYDDEDCRYAFVYKKINETHYTVKAQKERECPPKVFLLGIVLGVIAAVVLMGLAILLLWKLLTTIHDRREFARFEKERMMAKWDTGENPIYKQATSTFKNPTYAGKG